jgi:hypothetical protein
MLAEMADQYIESATDSPFMILTSQVKPEKRDVNPLYWRLIREFGPDFLVHRRLSDLRNVPF